MLVLYLLLCAMTGAAGGRALAVHKRRPQMKQFSSQPNFFPMLLPGSLAALIVANVALPLAPWRLGGASICAGIAGMVVAYRSHG
jgi:hypothetical protein